MRYSITIFLAVLLQLKLITALTIDQLAAASTLIRDAVDEDARVAGDPDNRRLLAGFLRLAFHDCVGDACDGCINVENDDNAGLSDYIDVLEGIYTTNELADAGWSRADFWAYAGREAVLYGCELSEITTTVPDIRFYYGREDCDTSPYTTTVHEFPDAHFLTSETLSFFQENFGFNNQMTTAIMGAHTLGLAHAASSGFVGPWVEQRTSFDNAYYSDLRNGDDDGLDFTMTNAADADSDAKWQWTSSLPARTMMLNADVGLVKNLENYMSDDGEVTGCTYDTCPDTPLSTQRWVAIYAADNEKFITDFSEAFVQMYENGYNKDDDASLVEPTS